MNPNLFFDNNQILRNKGFSTTYALGINIKNSIAYANDLKSLKSINKEASVSSIITTIELAKQVEQSKGVIISINPKKDFFELHNFMVSEGYIKPLNESKINQTAKIAKTAKIGKHVIIGENVTINDYVIIASNTIIGDDCEIEPFAVIGAKSMQQTIIDEQLFHLKYAGGVKIGNRSRVLTGAVIQKPYQAFYTTIGNNSVISTKVIIGHGSSVGNRSMLSGKSAIAGNSKIGDDVWIGGGAMIGGDGIIIENKAKVIAGSVVIKNVKELEVVSGNFAINHKKNIKNFINKKS